MSVGLHNLFADPAWVGGLHQDPSSASIITSTFSPTITTTSSFSASSYGHQCSNVLYSNKEDCEAANPAGTWDSGAPGTINVDSFDSNAAAGDKITFSSTAADGSYVTSRQSVLTLTQYHTASQSASTLTGVFDGPVASGATVVSHKTHLPRWIKYPGNTEVHKDSVVTLVAQTSYDSATHNYYNGGTAFRWVMSERIEHISPSNINPRTHATDPFGYPNVGGAGVGGDPDIFRTNDTLNGKAQGGDPNVDILNMSTPSANTCVLEIGPFGSMFNNPRNNVTYPSKKGAWWWCEQLLLDSSSAIQMVLQTPYFFLEVRD